MSYKKIKNYKKEVAPDARTQVNCLPDLRRKWRWASGETQAARAPKGGYEKRETPEKYKAPVSICLYRKHPSLGTNHLKGLEGRILEANTRLGIVPIPIRVENFIIPGTFVRVLGKVWPQQWRKLTLH